MYMGEGIDTGDMLEKASLEIGPDETADELRDRLSRLGAELLISTVERRRRGSFIRSRKTMRKSPMLPC